MKKALFILLCLAATSVSMAQDKKIASASATASSNEPAFEAEYAVDGKTLGADWEELFVNMNDGSNEGIRHKTNPWFSSQFHPEACAGPLDTMFMFDKFVESLK